MVETLASERGIGIIGGEPECAKSFLALAVAAVVPGLRRFKAARPGPVLLFAAEDAGHIVRQRLQGIAAAAGADVESLDIAVIDVAILRLDQNPDRRRLQHTVERIRPRLSVLDPLVRPHRVDDNAVAEIAPVPGFTAATCRAAWEPRCGSSTMPARAAPHDLDRPCEAPANCTPGATAPSTCADATSRSS